MCLFHLTPRVQCLFVCSQVVVERHPHSQISEIDKHKFLVPDDISVAQFLWIIRKRIQLSEEKALFLFVGSTIPQSSTSIGQLYSDFCDDDGFLYVMYSGENSFGSWA
ncbi:microtubule associated protein 1A/1B, light chain 3 [Opisthorchis viverrini]|uniref:Microtubule associated protein 1A/1B, light chain 3 n=1 Tax=Opisthorchis viverrini TaxID=6198 RepID=A0A1S8WTH8_OPIVI|nr:microtubule associated protein 1A/1B, light chain 3 [Opisthorchis viverrini]